VEACISAFMDKFGWSRKKTTNVLCLVGFTVSLVFCSSAGLFILDIVDHFINNLGILGAAFLEIFFLSWLCRLEMVRTYVNEVSDFRVGSWWVLCLRYLTVTILGVLVVTNIVGDVSEHYSGYDLSALLTFGWGVVLTSVLVAFVFQVKNGRVGFVLKSDKDFRR